MSYEKVYIILSLILVQLERVYANQTSDAMSDLALANVDALAQGESGGPKDATGCRSENTINCKDTSGCQ